MASSGEDKHDHRVRKMLKRNGSSKPKKNRKEYFERPLHKRQKKMSAPLTKEAKAEYKAKRAPVRRGDKVIVKKGDFEGQIGKVTRVDTKDYQIYIDGVSVEKPSGQNVPVPVRPWNVSIMDFKMERTRREILERKEEPKEWEELEESVEEEVLSEEAKEEKEVNNRGGE